MAEAKRDYYEVLGVGRDADDAGDQKRHTARLRRSIILI